MQNLNLELICHPDYATQQTQTFSSNELNEDNTSITLEQAQLLAFGFVRQCNIEYPNNISSIILKYLMVKSIVASFNKSENHIYTTIFKPIINDVMNQHPRTKFLNSNKNNNDDSNKNNNFLSVEHKNTKIIKKV